MNKHNSSEGEELIEEFFKENDIKFQREIKISDLKGDSAPCRIADFYLPKYKVYVEFFGRWNIEKNKIKYRRKKDIYEKNKIPCIYIYPDNLGILNFIFYRRLKKVLKKHKLKWALFKLNWTIFQEKYSISILILLLLIIFLDNLTARIIFATLLILTLFKGIKEIFLK